MASDNVQTVIKNKTSVDLLISGPLCNTLVSCRYADMGFPLFYFHGTGWNSLNNSKFNIEAVTVRKCICSVGVWLPGHDFGHVFVAQVK